MDEWFDAARHCSLDGLRACLEKGMEKDAINAKDEYGYTALMHIVSRWGGSEECVDLLISNGADIHCLDNEGRGLIEVGYAGVTSALERMSMVAIENQIKQRGRTS
jgi:Ankyrin repeat